MAASLIQLAKRALGFRQRKQWLQAGRPGAWYLRQHDSDNVFGKEVFSLVCS